MNALGFSAKEEVTLNALTLDVVKSFEIEGEMLNYDQVRSSIACLLYTSDAADERSSVDLGGRRIIKKKKKKKDRRHRYDTTRRTNGGTQSTHTATAS